MSVKKEDIIKIIIQMHRTPAEQADSILELFGVDKEQSTCEHDWQSVFYNDTLQVGRYCPECGELEN